MYSEEWDQAVLIEEELAEQLFGDSSPYPEINGMVLGTTGDQKPAIIVNLEREPKDFNPFREYRGIPVIWKIVGKIYAL